MNYYGTRLSDNISVREPEGYLFCLNVPVARTGYQDYWPEELGLGTGSELIKVYRPEDEVFSPETMASFEGMPITDDHPEEGVDITNVRDLSMGEVHNIRRGKGDESDLILADLIIKDPGLIDKIMKEGKREISCGYTYELAYENGEYIQRQIRGNHVAVVDAGRAGHRVCIKDNSPRRERSKTNMKKSFAKLLIRMAKDGDVEEVAEILEELMEPETAAPAEAVAEVVEEVAAPVAAATEVAEDPSVVVETPEGNTVAIDETTLEELNGKLDRILALLEPAATDEDPIVEEVAEAIEEVLEVAEVAADPVESLSEETTTEEIAELVEAIEDPMEDECGEEENGEVISSGDALRAALKAVHPQLKKMSKKQRQKACADIAARLKKTRKASGNDAYSAIAGAKPKEADPRDLGKAIMQSRNPHCKK